MKAPTMEEAVAQVRRRFAGFERAEACLFDNATHTFVVRREGWSEPYAYYAGDRPGAGGGIGSLWRGPAEAKRLPIFDAYRLAASMPEMALVKARPRTKPPR